MTAKKKSSPPSQLGFVLETRVDRYNRTRLESEAQKRGESLKQILRGHVKRATVFTLSEERTKQGALQHNIQPGGEASAGGFVLDKLPRHRLKIQEGVGLGPDGKPRIIMYSYQFFKDDGTTRIFRFEYHPTIGKANSWGSKHHLHVELSPLGGEVSKIHFPVAEFLAEPITPDQVLSRVIEWSYQELK